MTITRRGLLFLAIILYCSGSVTYFNKIVNFESWTGKFDIFSLQNRFHGKLSSVSKKCEKTESPEIRINNGIKNYNKYWQKLNFSGGEFHLWKAFYDDRPNIGGPYVRIPAMTTRMKSPIVKCHLWHNNGKKWTHISTKCSTVYGWIKWWKDPQDNMIQAMIISCPIPSGNIEGEFFTSIPTYASLSVDDCSPNENLLQVITGEMAYKSEYQNTGSNFQNIWPVYRKQENRMLENEKMSLSNHNRTKRSARRNKKREESKLYQGESIDWNTKKIAVCSKWLDFYHKDLSVRLMEWIEMVRILGANHVFITKLHVHSNIETVLKYYVEQGYVTVTNFSLPGDQPNDPGEQHDYIYSDVNIQVHNEMISLYDCLYRAIAASYDYLVVMDIDELIVPVIYDNWTQLISYLKSKGKPADAYAIDRVYFLDVDHDDNDVRIHKIPKYLHMMTHVFRNVDLNIKSIHSLGRTVSNL